MEPEGSNFRAYGKAPHRVVLVHGGPGAAGDLAPLAGELSKTSGVIEAHQTCSSIGDLIGELHSLIFAHADKPVILVGHSWGAWLSMMYAARFPETTEKLILVATPPFDEDSARKIMQTRLKRLDREKSERLLDLMQSIDTLTGDRQNHTFREIAGIMLEADVFQPSGEPLPETAYDYSQYKAIWGEAEELRSSGEMLRQAASVQRPILFIHGDEDPHPAKAIEAIAKTGLPDCRFIQLGKCGHEPWLEKHARKRFFSILRSEILPDPAAG